MKKNIFLKNLYQIISFALVISIFIIFLLLGYFVSLNYENNNGWYLLLIAGVLIASYFIIGFYWIFQTVEIDEKGIKIKILGKNIRNVKWDNIIEIKYASVMRNPAYVLLIKNEKNINLDSRKSIKSAMIYYAPKAMKDKLNKNLTL